MYLIDIVLAYIIRYSEIHVLFLPRVVLLIIKIYVSCQSEPYICFFALKNRLYTKATATSVLFLNGYILEQQDAYRHKSLIMPEC